MAFSYRDPNTGDFLPLGGGGVPIGSIMGFGGNVAPEGWHLCDGTAHGSAELEALFGSPNTPDLRDKFILGASTARPRGTTGGASSVTLTAAQSGSPAHAHPTVATGTVSAWHTHNTGAFNTAGSHNHASSVNSTGYATDAYRNTSLNEDHVDYPLTSSNNAVRGEVAGGAHAHSGSTAGHNTGHGHTATVSAATPANASAAHENRPPFYAMTFIIKVV